MFIIGFENGNGAIVAYASDKAGKALEFSSPATAEAWLSVHTWWKYPEDQRLYPDIQPSA